jgi:hypothetical protein
MALYCCTQVTQVKIHTPRTGLVLQEALDDLKAQLGAAQRAEALAKQQLAEHQAEVEKQKNSGIVEVQAWQQKLEEAKEVRLVGLHGLLRFPLA